VGGGISAPRSCGLPRDGPWPRWDADGPSLPIRPCRPSGAASSRNFDPRRHLAIPPPSSRRGKSTWHSSPPGSSTRSIKYEAATAVGATSRAGMGSRAVPNWLKSGASTTSSASSRRGTSSDSRKRPSPNPSRRSGKPNWITRASNSDQVERLIKPEYDQAQARYDGARAQVDAAHAAVAVAQDAVSQANLALDDTVVRAPFGGLLASRSIERGALAGNTTVGFVVVDIDVVKATFAVPDSSLAVVRMGRHLAGTLDALSDPVSGV